MRALVVRPGPNFSVQDVARGWVAGLRECGVTVVDFNLDDRLTFYDRAIEQALGEGHGTQAVELAAKGIQATCYELWPDVVVVISGFFIPPAIVELIRNRGHKLVLVCTESPYEDGNQIKMAPFYDVVLVNDPANLDAFRERNPNTFYQPHCWNPAVHYRRSYDPDFASDFCFAGTAYPSRTEFFEAVDWDGIDVAFAGNWSKLPDGSPLSRFVCHNSDLCLDNTDVMDLYSSTKASANLYRKEAQTEALAHGWAMGPREVELAAVGTFYLTEERGENREVLPMIPTFTSPGDFEEKLRWWLAHDNERDAVAAEAQAAVAGRTFAESARRLLNRLDRLFP